MTPPSDSLNLATPAHTPVTSAAKTPQTNSKPSSSASTPSSNNNYAAPHTPIASAKRPRNNTTGRKSRSSIGTSQHTYGREIVRNHDNNGNSASHSNHKSKQEPLDVTPVRKMRLSEGGDNENKQMNRMQMSPMHKARPAVEKDQKNESESDTAKNKWVGIFSPVLNFLNHSTENNNHGHGENDPSMEEKIVTENGNDIEHDVDGDVKMEGEIQYDTDSPTSDASFSITYSNSMASIDDYGVPEEDAESIQEYNVEVNVEEEDDEEEDEFNPYLFMRFLPPYETVVPHPEHKICLPPKDKADPPITLVLDLDETLVHCTVEPIADASMVFPVFFNGIQYSVHVRTRPFLQEFLESVSKSFEVVVFTASQKVYADELLNRIDPGKKIISIPFVFSLKFMTLC